MFARVDVVYCLPTLALCCCFMQFSLLCFLMLDVGTFRCSDCCAGMMELLRLQACALLVCFYYDSVDTGGKSNQLCVPVSNLCCCVNPGKNKGFLNCKLTTWKIKVKKFIHMVK